MIQFRDSRQLVLLPSDASKVVDDLHRDYLYLLFARR